VHQGPAPQPGSQVMEGCQRPILIFAPRGKL
jgi:hypothetical protein